MKKFLVILLSVLFISFVHKCSYGAKIPLNPDSLSFLITQGGRGGTYEMVVTSDNWGAKLEYRKVNSVRKRYFDFLTREDLTISEYRTSPAYYQRLYFYNSYYVEQREEMIIVKFTEKEISGFINILNYVDFLHLKDIHLHNTLLPGRSIELSVTKNKSRNKKFVHIWGYSNYLYKEKRILRMLFLNEFVESLLFLRKDGKLNLWGERKIRF